MFLMKTTAQGSLSERGGTQFLTALWDNSVHPFYGLREEALSILPGLYSTDTSLWCSKLMSPKSLSITNPELTLYKPPH